MLKVFNTRALSANQRFTKALLYGIPTALGLGIAYGILSSLLSVEFSLAFVGIGWLIGWVIRTYGRGVQVKFSILAAVMAAVCFILADLVSYFGLNVFLYPLEVVSILPQWIAGYFATDFNALLGLAFRAFGIVMAYQNARIV
jgi:hypothetical protein